MPQPSQSPIPTLSYSTPPAPAKRFWPEFRQGMIAFFVVAILFLFYAVALPEVADFCGVSGLAFFALLYFALLLMGLVRAIKRRPGYLTGLLATGTLCVALLMGAILLSRLLR